MHLTHISVAGGRWNCTGRALLYFFSSPVIFTSKKVRHNSYSFVYQNFSTNLLNLYFFNGFRTEFPRKLLYFCISWEIAAVLPNYEFKREFGSELLVAKFCERLCVFRTFNVVFFIFVVIFLWNFSISRHNNWVSYLLNHIILCKYKTQDQNPVGFFCENFFRCRRKSIKNL